VYAFVNISSLWEAGVGGRNFDLKTENIICASFEGGETSQVSNVGLEELLIDAIFSSQREGMAHRFDVQSFRIYVRVTNIC
jgi:hypothetical protein